MGAVSLAGKRVAITGGARGLGKAFAESAVAAGATVLIADLLEDRGRETAKALNDRAGTAFFVPVDLALPESVDAFAASAKIGRAHV